MLPPALALAPLLGLAANVACAPAASSESISASGPFTIAVASTSSFPAPSATVSPISDDPNNIAWTPDDANNAHQPIRGSLGANIMSPQNGFLQQQNADSVAPPSTDEGSVSQFKWPLHSVTFDCRPVDGHVSKTMPAATKMAAVNMRLQVGAIRELHWHATAEWAYVLKGSTQITAVDSQGRNYIATVNPGDLWRSLQATGDNPDGSEVLLIFDSGTFDEDSTFPLSDWLAHVPKEVIAKNFQTDLSAWDHVPSEELYIFPSSPLPSDSSDVSSPQGTVPDPFSFPLSQVNATALSGGSVKVVDSTTFKISKTIAVAEVTVEPGAMRELHWHPTQDEWGLVLEGESRITVFASQSNSRTWTFQAGDISYIPASFGHYVENVGNTTLKFLEIFKSDRFEDISLNQWLALTPPELVKAHLGVDDDTIKKLSKTKPTVIGPSSNP